jgi:uncharacterized protein (DUF4415 family)
MPRSKQPLPSEEYGVPDADSPEWTAEKFARSIGFNELPERLRNKLSAIQEASRQKRGPRKLPVKQSVTIRFSPDVLTVLRSTGRGWQTRVDETLRREFLSKTAAAAAK